MQPDIQQQLGILQCLADQIDRGGELLSSFIRLKHWGITIHFLILCVKQKCLVVA